MTFLCGRAGVCALGAVVAKHAGDEQMLNNYLAQLREVLCFDFSIMEVLVEQYLVFLFFCCRLLSLE